MITLPSPRHRLMNSKRHCRIVKSIGKLRSNSPLFLPRIDASLGVGMVGELRGM
jgi:hypothetical protein